MYFTIPLVLFVHPFLRFLLVFFFFFVRHMYFDSTKDILNYIRSVLSNPKTAACTSTFYSHTFLWIDLQTLHLLNFPWTIMQILIASDNHISSLNKKTKTKTKTT